jgi:hypothetical protein
MPLEVEHPCDGRKDATDGEVRPRSDVERAEGQDDPVGRMGDGADQALPFQMAKPGTN